VDKFYISVLSLVAIVPLCNDPFKFYSILHEIWIATDIKKEVNPKIIGNGTNIGYYVLVRMIRRYHATFTGPISLDVYDINHQATSITVANRELVCCVHAWTRFILRIREMESKNEIDHNRDDLFQFLCNTLGTEKGVLRLSNSHLENGMRVLILLNVLGKRFYKCVCFGVNKESRSDLYSLLGEGTGVRETSKSFNATVEAIAAVLTEDNNVDKAFNLLEFHLKGYPVSARMVLFPYQALYDVEYDQKTKEYCLYRHYSSGDVKEKVEEDAYPVMLLSDNGYVNQIYRPSGNPIPREENIVSLFNRKKWSTDSSEVIISAFVVTMEKKGNIAFWHQNECYKK
jgi:hypothetical protein